MNRLIRIVSAAILAVVLGLYGATVALATDFYQTQTCWPYIGNSYAKLFVSNYDVGATGQQYHWHAYGSSTPTWTYVVAVYYDGVRQSGSEGYSPISTYTTTHTISATWGPTTKPCSVRF